MHTESVERWIHDHTFGQDRTRAGERRTLIVIFLTAVTMVAEIAAGVLLGSMALLADGLHMGSHAFALSISAFAYFYTRRHARDPRFNFGTGKVNSLGGFASAVILLAFAGVMVFESTRRFIKPVPIHFDMAIVVAFLGLLVNGASIFILRGWGRGDVAGQHAHRVEEGHPHVHGLESDHNLWSAYLHVAADALTSLLAVFALLGGKYLGQTWLDPLMGILGALLVTRWSWGLLRSSARVLLDMRAPEPVREAIRRGIEAADNNRISDQHVWAVGPGIYAAELCVVTGLPRPPEHYWDLIPRELGLVHLTVEVRRCPECGTRAGGEGEGSAGDGTAGGT
ncbi:MAG: CDF family Co(II)/Ni(II) efflux transporter DmeF [bacterium]|nr:MAG: CDF family Co(II)/Ni(II) efflux transporter DmeF [bacterium]